MANVISDRVAYFLKDFPPFSFLKEEERAHIAEQVTVKFYRPGEVIFSEGEQGLGSCFVLHKGNVKLIKKVEGIDQLVDQCEPGDIFGVRSLLSGNPYVMSATVEEETLVYAIPQKVFEHYLDSQQQFARYFAAGYASGQVIVRSDQSKESVTLPSAAAFENEQLQFSNKVVTCAASATIQEAAKIMQSHKVGSIIVASDKGEPIGIVTDTDLRNKVVAEGVAVSQLISNIMTSPVKTVSPVITLGEAMGRMISQKVHHLVVTKDGTDQSKLAGIISDHDVMLSQKNHPAALIKAIKRSDSIEEWAAIRGEADTLLSTYLKQEVSISLVSGLISTINETIIEKAIVKGVEEIFQSEAADFCWMHLGSEGREEQLLRTDQDNAIIYSDAVQGQRERYLKLGEYVNDVLATCGFEMCPAEVMARNPSYNLSSSGWKNLFDRWIKTPDPKSLMNATIFFDFRMGEGNPKLVLELQEYLASQLKKHDIFLNHLAANALQNPPPLSFFKGFVVERSGEHKNDFDIKKRAMMPLSDAARLLCLSHGIVHLKSTIARFDKLAELEPKNSELFRAAGQAYGILMRQRAISGLSNQDSGRFVQVDQLNKLQKQVLKNAFLPIKELQELISVRFQSAYFN
jgi:CBS domain-containing protein